MKKSTKVWLLGFFKFPSNVILVGIFVALGVAVPKLIETQKRIDEMSKYTDRLPAPSKHLRLKRAMFLSQFSQCAPGSIGWCGGDGESRAIRKCLPTKIASYVGAWGRCVSLTKAERAQGYCLAGEMRMCGKLKGECTPGTQSCYKTKGGYIKGKWSTSPCYGNIEPTTEVCDGRDNDCNGVLDNGLTSCDTQAHLKLIKIEQAKEDARLANMCLPGSNRTCGEHSKGQCQFGTQNCEANGEWGECIGALGPKPESCDGLDNDCNGVLDNGLKDCDTKAHLKRIKAQREKEDKEFMRAMRL
ncbi:putative metal-binding motif-containing protein [Patescibacteria group bacterium]